MQGVSRRVLVVDPDPTFRSVAQDAFGRAGHDVKVAATADEGLETLLRMRPDVLVVELEIPGRDGAWLLRRLRDAYMGQLPKVVVACSPDAVSPEVGRLGAEEVILKPAPPAARWAASAPRR